MLETITSLLCNPVMLVIGFVLLITIYYQYKFSYWKKRGIPYDEPSFIFGNFKEVLFQRICVGQFLQKIYNKGAGKPFIGFYIFGRPALVLRDPELIKLILVKDFNIFYDRHTQSNQKTDPLSNNLFLVRGAPWKYLRHKMTPSFTTFRIKNMFPLMLTCGTRLGEYLKNAVSAGKETEIKEAAGKFATDLITSCAFGIESNCLLNPKSEFREFGRKVVDFTVYRCFEFMSFFMLPFAVKHMDVTFFSKHTTAFLRKAFWETMLEREEKKIVRNDFMDLLLQLKNEGQIAIDKNDDEMKVVSDNNEVFDENEIFEFKGDNLVAQAAIFFTAGFESNASTNSFTLFHLSKKPHIQEKLRSEILRVLGKEDGKISYDAIMSMEYLHMVVSETLRKYPPLPVLDRIPSVDYTIPGTDIVIEKGTPVYISLMGLHNDPEVYPDPDNYDPERFNAENKRSRHAFKYLPFGEGPKYCIGKQFGLMAAKVGLVSVLSQFEVSPCEGTPETLTLNPKAFILAAKGGIPLKFTPLKK